MKIETRPPYPWEPEGAVVRIETPEQTVVEYPIATFATRFGAALIDWTIVFVLVTMALLALAVSSVTDADGGIIGAVSLSAMFVLPFAYFLISEMAMNGQSIGKRVVRCRVIASTGHKPTFLALLVRNLARFVDLMPIVWLVPGLDAARRRIGDHLASTLVVMLERPGQGTGFSLSRLAQAERQFSFSGDVASRVAPDDINLLEYFFARGRGKRDERGDEAALRIAQKYLERLELEAQRAAIEADPGRFLRELYVFLRERFDRETY